MKQEQSAPISPCLISCIKITKYNSPQNRKSYGKRISHYFELEFILDGSGEIYVNGQWIPAIKNRLFIRSKGMELEGVTPYSSYYLVFDGIDQNVFADLPYYMDIEEGFYIQTLFETIYAEYHKGSKEREYLLQGTLCLLIAYLIRRTEQNKQKKQSKLYEVMEYMNQNLEEEISSASLAQMAGLSQNYFIKQFKEGTGKTPIAYMNDLRVAKGCSMLVSTNYSVEDIAKACGYPSTSYFYRKFKQKTGESPDSYRKKMRIYQTIG